MSPQVPSSRPVVAIIDDETDILIFLGLAFEDHGFQVVSSSDSSAAVALLEEASPDLIFLDLLMPGQTGVTLYAELKAHPSLAGTPVIIMSGLADRREMKDMLQRAGDLPSPAAIVEKPIDLDELIAIVDRLLGDTLEVSP